jgi:hypothetical protein
MSSTTSARLNWNEGISLIDLSKRMSEFAGRAGLSFDNWANYGGDAELRVENLTGALSSAYLNIPPPYDPMLNTNFHAVSWRLREPDGRDWGRFTVRKEYNPGTKVHVVQLWFDLLFLTGIAPTDFEAALRKYHHLKLLYETADCDELVGVNQQCVDFLDTPWLPAHRDKDFRFAKQGTQVLVRQLEERRMIPGLTAQTARIFIDPPKARTDDP